MNSDRFQEALDWLRDHPTIHVGVDDERQDVTVTAGVASASGSATPEQKD